MGRTTSRPISRDCPPWYEILITTRDGHVARAGQSTIIVAMNARDLARDVKEVAPGGATAYDSTCARPALA